MNHPKESQTMRSVVCRENSAVRMFKKVDWKTFIACAGFVAGVFIVYADRHNDERYIPRLEYTKDQTAIIKSLDEIKMDVKEILKERRNP